MSKPIYIRVNLIEEVYRSVCDNKDFNPHEWCVYDAKVLENAARIIRRELKEVKNEQANTRDD